MKSPKLAQKKQNLEKEITDIRTDISSLKRILLRLLQAKNEGSEKEELKKLEQEIEKMA